MLLTTRNKAASYAAAVWVERGGAALTNESDPNTLAPDDPTQPNSVTQGTSRIIQARSGIFITSGFQIIGYAIGGTSSTVRFWWYDDTKALWVPNGGAVTLTSGTTNSGSATVGCMPGAKWFAQVLANTGITKLAYLLR